MGTEPFIRPAPEGNGGKEPQAAVQTPISAKMAELEEAIKKLLPKEEDPRTPKGARSILETEAAKRGRLGLSCVTLEEAISHDLALIALIQNRSREDVLERIAPELKSSQKAAFWAGVFGASTGGLVLELLWKLIRRAMR